jgi:hypothetical protein
VLPLTLVIGPEGKGMELVMEGGDLCCGDPGGAQAWPESLDDKRRGKGFSR